LTIERLFGTSTPDLILPASSVHAFIISLSTRDSSESIVIGYKLDYRGSVLVRYRILSLSHRVQVLYVAHPASYATST
jgi:hypothetical protein